MFKKNKVVIIPTGEDEYYPNWNEGVNYGGFILSKYPDNTIYCTRIENITK